MPNVEFHTLEGESDSARFRLACSLAERSYLAGERVLVWLDDDAALTAFDNLLWTFADGSFVPHEPLADADAQTPVQLTCEQQLPGDAGTHFQTLLQLREQAGDAALQFERVIEVVDAHPARRNAGRTRFRFYRERGIEPRHFKDG